jgi:predicted HTH domain antitoxin
MKLSIDVPWGTHVTEADAKILFAAALFQAGKLSLGKASEVAGLSYRTFYEILQHYSIPVVSYTEDQVRAEIENVKQYL